MDKFRTCVSLIICLVLFCFTSLISTPAHAADLTITPVAPDTPKPKVLWERTFETRELAKGYKLVAIPGDGVIVAIPKFEQKNKLIGIWLIRLDKNGEELWNKIICPESDVHRIYELKLSADNTIVFSCDLNWKEKKAYYPWLVKVSLGGKVLWQRVWKDPKCSCTVGALDVGEDGIITFAGVKRCFLPPDYQFAVPHPWVGKIDLDGAIIWENVLTNIHRGGFLSMVMIGKQIVAGGGIQNEKDESKAIIASFNSDGKLLWLDTPGMTDLILHTYLIKPKNDQVTLIMSEFRQRFDGSEKTNILWSSYNRTGKNITRKNISVNKWYSPKHSVIFTSAVYKIKENRLWLFGHFVDFSKDNITEILFQLDGEGNVSNEYLLYSDNDYVSLDMSIVNDNNIFLLRGKSIQHIERKTQVVLLELNTTNP